MMMKSPKFLSLVLLLVSPATSFVTRTSHSRVRSSPSAIIPQRGASPYTGPRTSSMSMIPFVLEEVSHAYKFALENYFLQTQCVTSATLTTLGDALAQTKANFQSRAEEDASALSLEMSRSKSFLIKGLGAGVIWSSWYAFADTATLQMVQTISSSIGQNTDIMAYNIDQPVTWIVVRTMLSIALEQFVAAPIIFSLWDIPLISVLRGQTDIGELKGEVSTKLGGLLTNYAKVWTVVNVLVYNVPLEMRVLVMSFAELFWQSIMSEHTATDSESPSDDTHM
eukprot:CAMPEP_0118724032 /NCGR_PEP_ID=MMETSP0800-20121206/32328_1 /TAXON_ID=210618 ORGANISM="Striatella unipunctata, Strain CCMP2910" /NCGR_SAMPLE_ID=MMETSP0800 /ASSEMBLY_ACC=CAM_ASM_000638 /LENGTH=280 /DNA_ID=CAMNT_0006632513 /DNA_START=174 /DNA_END=1016 /DNA_ORIENTATION=-